ncbi:hypothetical protein U14_00515 [Candidatus Moduliflexus flocculans]|uniref:Uncharacterized protein n=1 Tax=Candidatus Moduliflexus flocculans TaxID=1499966 RepID=A0A0S6VWY8_9BACT|nr:hypothetical protein U14_00515 [Candidatus Moduliflexus flocculans]
METSSIIALIFAAIILTSTLVIVRRRRVKEQQALLDKVAAEKDFQQIDLIRVQNPTEQDNEAYALIERERQKVWKSLSLQTSIAPGLIWKMCYDLVARISAVYSPESDNPIFQVSLSDLLGLNDRVIRRIQDYLEQFPLNAIKDMKVQDILTYKDWFDKVSQNKAVQFAQQHKYLYTAWQYGWMVYNSINPWYWGRKVIFEAGREGSFRYLLSVILTIVGEEAVMVYSKRRIRQKAVAIEKGIAVEMINMAVADQTVSAQEYEVLLSFILNSNKFDDMVKVTLLKALLRKQTMKSPLELDSLDEKERKRFLMEVERVAKADKLGVLKKLDALKTLEDALSLTSGYRTQLELAPHEEVRSMDVMQQNRKREEAIFRLMIQAGSVDGTFPQSLREYIIERAENYPLPFDADEQDAILQEADAPTPIDTLTKEITSQPDKERALAETLDALLWYLPFTRKDEEFFVQLVAVLHLRQVSDSLLQKRMERLLPQNKLIGKPAFPILKLLCRQIQQEEQILALVETGSSYQFQTNEERPKKKDAAFWLCVTTERALLLTAAMLNGVMYTHQVDLKPPFTLKIERGRLHDTYALRDAVQEFRLSSALFHSDDLRAALEMLVKRQKQHELAESA